MTTPVPTLISRVLPEKYYVLSTIMAFPASDKKEVQYLEQGEWSDWWTSNLRCAKKFKSVEDCMKWNVGENNVARMAHNKTVQVLRVQTVVSHVTMVNNSLLEEKERKLKSLREQAAEIDRQIREES